MNSVMDMNKTLTLASNERIPLKPNMRMIFEIRDLKYASLATVTRAGVLFISNDKGTQWKAMLSSWVSKREDDSQLMKDTWTKLFDDTCEKVLFYIKSSSVSIVPIEDTGYIASLLHMLDSLLTEEFCKPLEPPNG